MKKVLYLVSMLAIVVLLSGCLGQNSRKDEAKTPPAKKSAEPQPAAATKNDLLEVTAPIPGQSIKSPVQVAGKSNFFEANTRIRIKDDEGMVLADTFTTAQGWMDALYPFSADIAYKKPQSAKGSIEIFEPSPKDGSDTNKISIPVTFKDFSQ